MVSKNNLTNDDNNEKNRFIDRLIELYDDRAKAFRRDFSLLLTFAVIFLFIIFLPYMSLLGENKQINHRISDLSNKIFNTENYLTVIANQTKDILVEMSVLTNYTTSVLKNLHDTKMAILRNIEYTNNANYSYAILEVNYNSTPSYDTCDKSSVNVNDKNKCISGKMGDLFKIIKEWEDPRIHFNGNCGNVCTSVLGNIKDKTLTRQNLFNNLTTIVKQLGLNPLIMKNFPSTHNGQNIGLDTNMDNFFLRVLSSLYTKFNSDLNFLSKQAEEKKSEEQKLSLAKEQLLQNRGADFKLKKRD